LIVPNLPQCKVVTVLCLRCLLFESGTHSASQYKPGVTSSRSVVLDGCLWYWVRDTFSITLHVLNITCCCLFKILMYSMAAFFICYWVRDIFSITIHIQNITCCYFFKICSTRWQAGLLAHTTSDFLHVQQNKSLK